MIDQIRRTAELLAAEERFYTALRALPASLPDLLACWADDASVTTMNAAGGVETGPDAVRGRWTWWAGQGRPMPANRVETLASTITPELACIVAREHHGARVLRVTHLWRHTDQGWRLVHRHADPLVERQG